MTTKHYSNSGNCARAARVALKNKDAKNGTDFAITKHEHEGKAATFTFALKTRQRANRGEAKPLAQQPRMQEMLKLMSRKDGVTVAAGAKALGVEEHTFRGSASRLTSSGVAITKTRDEDNKKTVVYRHDGSALI